MRIKTFSKKVEVAELDPYTLQNCNVVIDGQNYFYNLYQKFGLPYVFGCEADKYAHLLRRHLLMFKESNVKVYVLFKGGHEDKERAYKPEKGGMGRNFVLGAPEEREIVMPVFMKAVYKDILTELGIQFVVCQFESKQQCIALAQKLKCPIISFDIEFCFSGVPYIPIPSIQFDTKGKLIKCGIFNYDNFKGKYNLDDEKVAIFIALTDEKIDAFSEDTFQPFFRSQRFPLGPYKRNEALIRWLSKAGTNEAYRAINRYLKSQDKDKFKEEVDNIRSFICRVETPGIPVECLLAGNKLVVHNKDPKWFEKGVALGHISIKYVNLYHWNLKFGSWCIEDTDANDAMMIAVDIIAYAFNLMTNYKNNELIFYSWKDNESGGEVIKIDVTSANSRTISKPSCLGRNNVFENGWDQVKSLGLMDHFLKQSLGTLDVPAYDSIPDDAKLLVLALALFSRQKTDDTTKEVYSILLSYVLLNVVSEKVDINNDCKGKEPPKKPIMDPITDKNLVTEADCNVAHVITRDFFKLTTRDLYSIFDRKLIHPFVEFQHCLNELNELNKLCGKPYEPTLYHKTYNGTFVYKLFYSMNSRVSASTSAVCYIDDMLSPAPSVLAFLKGLIEAYDGIVRN